MCTGNVAARRGLRNTYRRMFASARRLCYQCCFFLAIVHLFFQYGPIPTVPKTRRVARIAARRPTLFLLRASDNEIVKYRLRTVQSSCSPLSSARIRSFHFFLSSKSLSVMIVTTIRKDIIGYGGRYQACRRAYG